ncbi:helix-turn-helix domain-containing protein [Azospirillum sp. ST 5-10]|uniref:helix-turn-helix domain-containing protein n=1 Tax=unclassified Azospirillum TaxID=2630922 RepID=UPI003F49DEF9
MEYPNRIRQLREAKGWSTIRLADAAHTTNQQIGRLERGERKLTQAWMDRLSRALGCNPWDLLPYGPGISKEESEDIANIRALTPAVREKVREHIRNLADLYRDQNERDG